MQFISGHEVCNRHLLLNILYIINKLTKRYGFITYTVTQITLLSLLNYTCEGWQLFFKMSFLLIIFYDRIVPTFVTCMALFAIIVSRVQFFLVEFISQFSRLFATKCLYHTIRENHFRPRKGSSYIQCKSR
jgi:hypothetical protein